MAEPTEGRVSRIDRGTVVTLAFELKDCDGQPLDEPGAEMAYLHGFGGIFPKVEEALQGKRVGHEMSVTLDPDDAFGEYDAELLRVEGRERFPETLEVGMRFEGIPGDREEDMRIYTVTDITDDKVVVDGNHPLAGERLWFKCKVKDVRKATEDELAHGHVHGDTGLSAH
jgi:FKBP-type peptidyl-prolyl cis-trans isomerase SlyD